MNRRFSLSQAFDPEDLLTFIELSVFTNVWQKLKLTDEDLFLLQVAIMCDPTGSPVIPGTNGVRKLRFAPADSSAGKRDSM